MSTIVKKISAKPYFKALSRASQEQIAEAQKTLGLEFSCEYNEYLSELGIATFDGHELTGICSSKRLSVVDVTISEREKNPNTPADWYVIEQANIDGIVIWQSGAGEIYQTMPGASPMKLCNSLSEYIDL